jgi:dihydrolipoamide dehydrogenase
LRLDERGHVWTDESCRTSLPGVYAIGDVTGPPYLAHKAFKEAEVAADVLCGSPSIRDYRALPNAIFSDPEIGITGLGEEEARKKLKSVSVGRFPFAALGKAQAIGDSEGFVKVIASEGRVVGITAVGPHVTELLGEGGVALETAATVEDLALTIHPHPTLSEAMREAAEVLLGQPIHVQGPKRSAQARS